jgi:hypothetical protein
MRAGLAPALSFAALSAACAPEQQQPFIVAAPPPPELIAAACSPFSVTVMEAGRTRVARGEACPQSDGSWRIIREEPLPDAAIATGVPLPPEDIAEATLYYSYDPSERRSSFLTGGGYGYGYGYGYRGAYWNGGFRHWHGFGHGHFGGW